MFGSSPAHLCDVVDLKRGLALRVKVAVAFHLVKFTNNDLYAGSESQYSHSSEVAGTEIIDRKRTSWLEPGSFTVASWLSLYRSKAGASEERISSPSEVRACTSARTRESAAERE
jgi:hypothetical protein